MIKKFLTYLRVLMLQKLIYYILSFLLLVGCFENSEEQDSGGGLFYNNQKVEDTFELIVPSNATYSTGDALIFSLNHPVDIDVIGTPRLELTIGSNTRYADYSSGSGSNNLIFSYTDLGGDEDLDGIDVPF